MSRNNQSWKDLISHQLLTKPRKQFRHELQHSVSIPAEIFKAAGLNALADMPEDFCNVLIVALYKKKGSKSDRVNYRGISLLSIEGKIFACPNRLITVSERSLPEEQCGFRRRSSNVDKMIVVRQVKETCIAQNKALY